MSADSGQAQCAENVLTGERSYRRVEFAITGHPDADLISGIHAVFREFPQTNARSRQRVLEYFANCYKDAAEREEYFTRQNHPTPWSGLSSSSGPNILPHQGSVFGAAIGSAGTTAKIAEVLARCPGLTDPEQTSPAYPPQTFQK